MKMPRKQQPTDLDRGQRVTALREALQPHVSQEKLAQDLGVAARTIQNWEGGKTISAPEKLARYFNTTISYILTGSDTPGSQDGESDDLVERLSRQQEILRRVASNRLLTAEQLAFLEQALDELEHPPPADEEASHEEDDQAAA